MASDVSRNACEKKLAVNKMNGNKDTLPKLGLTGECLILSLKYLRSSHQTQFNSLVNKIKKRTKHPQTLAIILLYISFIISFCANPLYYIKMSSFDVTEFESMVSLDKPINSSAATRWERRAARQQQPSSQQPSQSDRYIPNRSGMDFDLMMNSDENGDANTSDHAKLLLANTLENKGDARVLAFKNKAPAPADGYQSSLKVLYSAQTAKKEVTKPTRHIPSAPIRVLDAPDMLDDYCKSFASPMPFLFYK